MEEAVAEGFELVGVAGEGIAGEPVEAQAQLFAGPVEVHGIVTLGAELGDFFDGEAEDEDVVVADFFEDLDIGSIERADGESAVEGELHVAGAGGFLASGGDLLAQIGGGDDALGDGDAVVRDEDDLQLATDAGIMVHLRGEGVDGVDDVFGEVVAGSGLGTENEDTRGDVEVRVVEELAIQTDDVDEIEMLALVFVQSLDLHIEERIGADADAAAILNDLGEAHFVAAFDVVEALLEGAVGGEFFEAAELRGVFEPAGADGLGDEGGELRIAHIEPAAEGDAIGEIEEALGEKLVELGEEPLAEQTRVQRGDAVRGVGTEHAHVGHAHGFVAAAFLDEREYFFLLVVAGPFGFDFVREEEVIDLVDDLEVARQHTLE